VHHLSSLGGSFSALVIGASGGIGAGFVERLADDPDCSDLVTLSRSRDGFDLTSETSMAAHAGHLAGRTFDLILCATGGLAIDGHLPEKALRQIDPAAMARQFAVNAIGPALIIKHFSPLLSKSGRSIFAVLSARVGSIGDNRLGGWISYRAAKAALNQIVHTAAIEIARTRPEAIVVSLHPGTVATPLSSAYTPTHQILQPAESAGKMLSVLDRLEPAQSGGFFAYDGSAIEW
jgi:NAD(P)-dependent dehydrogenase (short-subunit alcohol dehydrogenase family)